MIHTVHSGRLGLPRTEAFGQMHVLQTNSGNIFNSAQRAVHSLVEDQRSGVTAERFKASEVMICEVVNASLTPAEVYCS